MPKLARPAHGIVKPGEWNLDPAFVATEWRWAWDGLTVGFLNWAGGGATLHSVSSRDEATLNAVPWASSIDGPVLEFTPASNSYGTVPDRSALNPQAANTWVCRFYLRTFPETSGDANLAHIWGDEKVGLPSAIWRMGSAGDAALDRRIGVNYNDGSNHDIENDTDLSLDTWYTVVVTTDGANIRWYINGSLDTEKAYSIVPGQRNNRWTLGSNEAGKDRHIDGFISQMLYYPGVVWNAEQVAQHDRDPFGPFRMARRTMVVVPATAISNARMADMAFCRGTVPFGVGRLPIPDGTID